MNGGNISNLITTADLYNIRLVGEQAGMTDDADTPDTGGVGIWMRHQPANQGGAGAFRKEHTPRIGRADTYMCM